MHWNLGPSYQGVILMVQWHRLESAWFGRHHLVQFPASRHLRPPRRVHKQIDMAQTVKKRKTSGFTGKLTWHKL